MAVAVFHILEVNDLCLNRNDKLCLYLTTAPSIIVGLYLNEAERQVKTNYQVYSPLFDVVLGKA